VFSIHMSGMMNGLTHVIPPAGRPLRLRWPRCRLSKGRAALQADVRDGVAASGAAEDVDLHAVGPSPDQQGNVTSAGCTDTNAPITTFCAAALIEL
jgi:hypothetical protein